MGVSPDDLSRQRCLQLLTFTGQEDHAELHGRGITVVRPALPCIQHRRTQVTRETAAGGPVAENLLDSCRDLARVLPGTLVEEVPGGAEVYLVKPGLARKDTSLRLLWGHLSIRGAGVGLSKPQVARKVCSAMAGGISASFRNVGQVCRIRS